LGAATDRGGSAAAANLQGAATAPWALGRGGGLPARPGSSIALYPH